MFTENHLVEILILILPFAVALMAIKLKWVIRLALFIIYCLLVMYRTEIVIFSNFIQFLNRYSEIIWTIVITFVIFYIIIYLCQYRKKEYKDIITKRIQNIDVLSYRLYNKRRLTDIVVEQWKNGICELLHSSLILLKWKDYQELSKYLRKVRKLLKFTADSDYAYYIRIALMTTSNLDRAFFQRKIQQISDVNNSLLNINSVSFHIEDFLRNLIEEINSQFRMYKSDISAAFFSKKIKPSPNKFNIGDIALLNFRLWEKSAITSVKYFELLSWLSFLFILLGPIFPRHILIYVIWFINLVIFYFGFSGINNIKFLVGESLRFFESKSKTFEFENAPKLVVTYKLWDNLNWLEEMTDEKKSKNLSILLYLITTFPKQRLKDFTPLERLNFLHRFKRVEIPKRDSTFALKLPFRYLEISILNFRKDFKKSVQRIVRFCAFSQFGFTFVVILLTLQEFTAYGVNLYSLSEIMPLLTIESILILPAILCWISEEKYLKHWKIYGPFGLFSLCLGIYFFCQLLMPLFIFSDGIIVNSFLIFFSFCLIITGIWNLRRPLRKMMSMLRKQTVKN